ncbi:MAG: 30S ribosomal protein S18 [bacterium]|nr:30S ribosomal protein S18 [bacterium]
MKTKERQCHYCVNNKKAIDYKDIQTLRRFVSSYMKIAPRRRSGLCAYHQRKVSTAIKQARIAGLLAFVPK